MVFAPLDGVAEAVVALLAVALLVALLRWTFTGGRSVVTRPGRRGPATDYGLLVPVSRPRDRSEARATCRVLAEAGIRATDVGTADGLRVMVFAEDADRAAAALGAR